MTSYYEREEWPAFLAAILAAPDDDLPRLVTADWLDDFETEEATERAEFIRVQCELAKTPELVWRNKLLHRAEWDAIRQRAEPWGERLELASPSDAIGVYHYRETNQVHVKLYGRMSALADGIYGPLLGPVALAGGTWVADRGFVTRVSAPLSVLNGERCRCMEHTRLTGPCDCCGGTGRTAGVLGELLRREPVTAAGIEVTQVAPVGVVPNEYLRNGTGPERNWAWGFSESTPHGEYMIPRDVWDLIPPTTLTEPRGRFKVFPTADAARLALGSALIRLHGPKSEVTT